MKIVSFIVASLFLATVSCILLPFKIKGYGSPAALNSDEFTEVFDIIKRNQSPLPQPATVKDNESDISMKFKLDLGRDDIDCFWLPNTFWDLFVLKFMPEISNMSGVEDLFTPLYDQFFEFVMGNIDSWAMNSLSHNSLRKPTALSFLPAVRKLLKNAATNDEESFRSVDIAKFLIAEETRLPQAKLRLEHPDTPIKSVILAAISAEITARASGAIALFPTDESEEMYGISLFSRVTPSDSSSALASAAYSFAGKALASDGNFYAYISPYSTTLSRSSMETCMFFPGTIDMYQSLMSTFFDNVYKAPCMSVGAIDDPGIAVTQEGYRYPLVTSGSVPTKLGDLM